MTTNLPALTTEPEKFSPATLEEANEIIAKLSREKAEREHEIIFFLLSLIPMTEVMGLNELMTDEQSQNKELSGWDIAELIGKIGIKLMSNARTIGKFMQQNREILGTAFENLKKRYGDRIQAANDQRLIEEARRR